jgi:hypothetical protein
MMATADASGVSTGHALDAKLLKPPLPDLCLLYDPVRLQVSAEDAIEGMAYYIALYLSRAPEARYMEPKQLQAALRQTMTVSTHSHPPVTGVSMGHHVSTGLLLQAETCQHQAPADGSTQ